jgi:hypothetical protein
MKEGMPVVTKVTGKNFLELGDQARGSFSLRIVGARIAVRSLTSADRGSECKRLLSAFMIRD